MVQNTKHRPASVAANGAAMPADVRNFRWWGSVKDRYFAKIAEHADGFGRASAFPDKNMLRQVRVFDTTARDGMQMPDAFLTEERGMPVMLNKIDICVALARWGIPIIEVGNAVSSPEEKGAIREAKAAVVKLGLDTEIVSLARTHRRDIREARDSEADIIHIFSSGSIPHAWVKFGRAPADLIPDIVDSIRYARRLGFRKMVFSLEDALRSDPAHLVEVARRIYDIGDSDIHYNIPDTVGAADPAYMFALISYLRANVPIPLQVHCHNCRGRAVDNTIAAMYAGVSEIHTTMHGMGERTGNASLEQVAVNMYTSHGVKLVDLRQIRRISEFIKARSGVSPAVNAPVVGDNAFLHESGVHGDAVDKSQRMGYGRRRGRDGGSIYTAYGPALAGREEEVNVGPLCGRANVVHRLRRFGAAVPEEKVLDIVAKVKAMAARSRVSDADFVHIAYEAMTGRQCAKFLIEDCHVETGIDRFRPQKPEAWVKLRLNGRHPAAHGRGNGAVDAAVNAIGEALGEGGIKITSYELKAIGRGSSAKGRVTLSVKKGGTEIKSSAVGTDIVIVTLEAFRKGFDALEALEQLRRMDH